MKHKFEYKNEDKVLVLSINGEYSREEAIELGNQLDTQLEGKPYRQMVVDLSDAGKMQDRETRQLTKDNIDEAGVTDIAFVGASAAVRMIAKVLMKLGTQKASGNFFKSYDEAVKWLKNRRK